MSQDEKPHEIIIVRRKRGGHDAHHGGVWKIAFADFMTAMMAFFLVLWIVNSTSKETRSSVARYFNPIKLAETTPARKGLQDPKENEFQEPDKKPTSGGQGGDKQAGSEPGSKGAAGEADTDRPAEAEKKAADKAQKKKAPAKEGGAEKEAPPRPGYFSPTRSEAELFEDPMAALADIARAEPRAGTVGLDAPKTFRDPFEPIAPVITPLPSTGPTPRADLQPQRGAPKGFEGPSPESMAGEPEKGAVPEENSPTKGGKPELAGAANQANKQVAENAAREPAPAAKAGQPALAAAKTADAAADPAANVEILQARVTLALKDEVNKQGAPHVDIRKTDEGLLISLTDNLDFGMFAIGSAEPQPRTVRVLEKLGKALKDETGNLVVVGHTDSRPFKAGGSDNWRLSMSRAQMAFYMLLRGGLTEKRFERIEGQSDHSPRNTKQTTAAENRRIEILVRKPPSSR